MNELFPILGGLVCGIFAGRGKAGARLPLAAFLGAVAAVASTVLSGEYRIGWIYFLVDALLAIGTAVSAATIVAHLPLAVSNDLPVRTGLNRFAPTKRKMIQPLEPS